MSLAGVDLRLGMAQDSVLAKFAAITNVKLNEIGSNWYAVDVKRLDRWEAAGDLSFKSGKLIRISFADCSVEDKPARTLAKAFYSAVASGAKVGLVDVWTGTNDDANNPIYDVHVVFKDREIVIGTVSARDSESASVTTYFPRLRVSDKAPAAR